MSDTIKNLFRRVKKGKFSGLGPGHKLNDNNPSKAGSSSSDGGGSARKEKDAYVPPKSNERSAAAQHAREAALARMTTPKDPREFNTSLAAIKAQAKRELAAEMELKQKQQQQGGSTLDNAENKPKELIPSAVGGVYFRCPLVSDEVLSKVEWQSRIKSFLYEQLNFEEKGLTSCLIIVNCNVREKADACREIITKYIENIVNNPTEEKYRKIRMANKVYCEKVRDAEGSMEFLHAAGFVEQTIDEEKFLIWMPDGDNMEQQMQDLRELCESLNEAEVIALEVDRNIQVMLPSQAQRVDLPADFFRISPEEMKREQQMRANAIEQAQILKTKAMREREEARTLNMYRYTLIRIRFPDGIYIQGTFSVREALSCVYEFVQSCMKFEEAAYYLTGPAGTRMRREEDGEKTLAELKLVPTIALGFHYDTEDEVPQGNYVKEELMMLIK